MDAKTAFAKCDYCHRPVTHWAEGTAEDGQSTGAVRADICALHARAFEVFAEGGKPREHYQGWVYVRHVEPWPFCFGENDHYEHERGNLECPVCWTDSAARCVCGGIIHNNFFDESYDGYSLEYSCDRCGRDHEEAES